MQGGINAALGNMTEDDWRWHMYDTVKGSDWSEKGRCELDTGYWMRQTLRYWENEKVRLAYRPVHIEHTGW
ncbi:hypothetical protein QJS10_CPB17g02176 [Acorus calamus]|uniref:Uncharacterized protein n=1 Tax=Acorus calamus TaxID=4465 RepID=A0AAV9CXW9_ACOCL|nr:hypothetical protein QJS10_CPB17g02176 [Acorus calamus]